MVAVVPEAVVPEAVDAFLAVDPASLPDAALGQRIVALEAVIRRAQAAQAAAVRVFDARDAADAEGAGSTACWLRDRLRASDRDARQAVGLARALDRLPLTTAALGAGEVSVAHARTLAGQTRHLPAEVVAAGEGFLVGWARRLDPLRFATVVRRWVATVAPEAFERDTERRYDHRWLNVAVTFGGMVNVGGLLDPEGGALLTAALDTLVRANPPTDTRSRDQQRADALVDLVELARAHHLLPVSGGHRPEIIVHIPAHTLLTTADDTTGGTTGAAAEPGPALAGVGAAHTARIAGVGAAAEAGVVAGPVLGDGSPLTTTAFTRLACDAQLRRLLLDPAGVPAELGRATRIVPPALRKQIALRDGGCRYPGCPRGPAYCDAHHVVFWRHGGATAASNLVLLCRYHHHLVHDRAHQLTLRGDGTVRVTRPDGRTLNGTPRGPTPTPV